jgi:hypothetical protein
MTLEAQYKQFLKHNPDTTLSFKEWMKWHSHQMEQAIIQMMQDDEELGLYEEPKQETLEEFINSQPYYGSCTSEYLEGIEIGAKWQQEKSYSEEEVIDLLQEMNDYPTIFEGRIDIKEWFEQLKKK